MFSVVCEAGEDERDYDAEIVALLADGEWRTTREIADKEKGIGAGHETVKDRLEGRADLFKSCTGEEAKALGRRPSAQLWQLATVERDPGLFDTEEATS